MEQLLVPAHRNNVPNQKQLILNKLKFVSAFDLKEVRKAVIDQLCFKGNIKGDLKDG
jgi:hypothetical protein